MMPAHGLGEGTDDVVVSDAPIGDQQTDFGGEVHH
jgi:hypothetical protein